MKGSENTNPVVYMKFKIKLKKNFVQQLKKKNLISTMRKNISPFAVFRFSTSDELVYFHIHSF